MQSRARKMSADMQAEGDGVSEGLKSFYRHLPLEDMICEVSLLKGEVRLAHVFCKTCGLKMDRDVCTLIHAELKSSEAKAATAAAAANAGCDLAITEQTEHEVVPCLFVDWSLPPPANLVEGVMQGLGAATHEVIGGITDALLQPVRGAYYGGVEGGINGVVSGFKSLFSRPVLGTQVMVSKVSEGLSGSSSVGAPLRGHIGGHVSRAEDATAASGEEDNASSSKAIAESFEDGAARWYGAASMMMMATAAEARGNKSIFVEDYAGFEPILESISQAAEDVRASIREERPSDVILRSTAAIDTPPSYSAYDSSAFEALPADVFLPEAETDTGAILSGQPLCGRIGDTAASEEAAAAAAREGQALQSAGSVAAPSDGEGGLDDAAEVESVVDDDESSDKSSVVVQSDEDGSDSGRDQLASENVMKSTFGDRRVSPVPFAARMLRPVAVSRELNTLECFELSRQLNAVTLSFRDAISAKRYTFIHCFMS
jgi:hypothetical protein